MSIHQKNFWPHHFDMVQNTTFNLLVVLNKRTSFPATFANLQLFLLSFYSQNQIGVGTSKFKTVSGLYDFIKTDLSLFQQQSVPDICEIDCRAGITVKGICKKVS